jgi:hypothetical protein
VKIPLSILYEWKAHWQQAPMWRLWEKETHGKHHHASSDEEELELAAMIVDPAQAVYWNYILGTGHHRICIYRTQFGCIQAFAAVYQ